MVAEEEKLVEAPPKNAAALETELDAKFAVAPSLAATATAEAEVAADGAERRRPPRERVPEGLVCAGMAGRDVDDVATRR